MDTAYPATSLTNPRSSSRLNMLCCAPVLILPACSPHSACRAASSAYSAAHRFFGRSPRARVCWLRIHCRQTYCRRCDTCLSINIAVNGSGAKHNLHLKSDDQARTDRGFPEHLRTATAPYTSPAILVQEASTLIHCVISDLLLNTIYPSQSSVVHLSSTRPEHCTPPAPLTCTPHLPAILPWDRLRQYHSTRRQSSSRS